MNALARKHAQEIEFSLTGFDRLVLRGTLRTLACFQMFGRWMSYYGILLKDFGEWSLRMTEELKERSLAEAQRQSRPIEYLGRSSICKEDRARLIAERDQVAGGTVCVFKTLETCASYEIHRDRVARRLELQPKIRQCQVLYHYWIDPFWGWMNARIQTWIPFSIQICVNGREWLAQRLREKRLAFEQRDNCFVQLADPGQAQTLMNELLDTDWPTRLDEVAQRLFPGFTNVLGDERLRYYWSAHQTEWATDLKFRDPAVLACHYPSLVRGGIVTFSCTDILRFLGKRPDIRFQGEVIGSYRVRAEGLRMKHAVGGNSLKTYDKTGCILRIEATVNTPRDMKVFRQCEGKPGPKRWMRMRKGVADLKRRAELSDKANERYMDALGLLSTGRSLGDLVNPLCQPILHNGRPVRGLRPWRTDERELLTAIARPEWNLTGFRNRNLAALLFPDASDMRRTANRVNRLIRILRAHGLVHKLPHTHRYQLSPLGKEVTATILQTQSLTSEDIQRLAA
jgi:hypothetical protein